MSLADITLNSKVFSARSWNGTSGFMRACTSGTLPAACTDATLLISHDFTLPPSAKANRSLFQLSRTYINATTGEEVPVIIHGVITAPKGLTLAQKNTALAGTGSMSDDLSDLLALDTFAFATRMLNGEFS